MSDGELASLSSRELLALQADIEKAIRNRIRERNERLSNYRPADTAQPVETKPIVSDLEAERNAWLARRGRGN